MLLVLSQEARYVYIPCSYLPDLRLQEWHHTRWALPASLGQSSATLGKSTSYFASLISVAFGWFTVNIINKLILITISGSFCNTMRLTRQPDLKYNAASYHCHIPHQNHQRLPLSTRHTVLILFNYQIERVISPYTCRWEEQGSQYAPCGYSRPRKGQQNMVFI